MVNTIVAVKQVRRRRGDNYPFLISPVKHNSCFIWKRRTCIFTLKSNQGLEVLTCFCCTLSSMSTFLKPIKQVLLGTSLIFPVIVPIFDLWVLPLGNLICRKYFPLEVKMDACIYTMSSCWFILRNLPLTTVMLRGLRCTALFSLDSLASSEMSLR